jgi:hypothetical protein
VSEWQHDDEGFTPVFVDTVTSDGEPPRQSGGLLAFVSLIIAALVALIGFGLTQGGGDDQPAVAEPTAVSPPSQSEMVEVAVAQTWSPATDPVFRLFSDGEVLCLRSSEGSIRETCGSIGDDPVEQAFFTALGGRPLLSSWCAVGAVGPDVQEVTLGLLDGTRSTVQPVTADADGRHYFAACRTDGLGLETLQYLGEAPAEAVVGTRGGGGSALVPSAFTLPPSIAELDVFPGWTAAQVGSAFVVANHPIEVPASSGNRAACTPAQLAVLSTAAPDSVMVSVVELLGLGGLPPRSLGLRFEPAQVAALFSCPIPDLDIRTARISDSGRALEVAIVVGPEASQADIDVAEATIGLMRIGARPDLPPHSRITAPPIPIVDDAAIAWTGDEVVVWGGSSEYETSVFDPRVGRLALFGSRYPTPVATDASQRGARWNPRTNTWRVLPDAPFVLSPANGYRSVWTGSELLVWNAGLGRGLGLDPATDTWRALPEWSPGVGFGWEPPVVWTGTEVIAFGPAVALSDDEQPVRSLGARYDPRADSWALLPRAPEASATTSVGAWTGSEAVFLLGSQTGLAFDPVTDQWRTTVGPDDTSSGSPVTDLFIANGVAFGLSRGPAAPIGAATLFTAPTPALEPWDQDVFPPSPISYIETAVMTDAGLFVIAALTDRGGWAAYLLEPDASVVPVPLPERWNRCGAEVAAVPEGVFFWGGADCDTATPAGDVTVIDLPGAGSIG